MPKTTFRISNHNKPAPKIWGRISTASRYFLVSVMTMLPGAEIMSADRLKITMFAMGMVILLLKSIDLGLGVSEEKINE